MFVKRNLSVITAFLVIAAMFVTGEVKSNAAGAGASSDTTVYVTKTGDCYHSSGCNSLRKSCISITLQEAIDDGYKPCRNCYPVALDTVPLTSEVEEEIEALKTYEGNTKEFNAYTYYMNNIDLQIEIGPTVMPFWSTLSNRVRKRKESQKKKREDRVQKNAPRMLQERQRSGCIS